VSRFYSDQPISDDQADEMYEAIFIGLGAGSHSLAVGCDHTLKHARQWCEAHDIPFESIKAWLHANGGFCDCEVLFNVMPDEDEE
jgi:hypothetical protein